MQNKTQVQEILTAHGLDFRIEKAPMFALNSEGEQVPSLTMVLSTAKPIR